MRYRLMCYRREMGYTDEDILKNSWSTTVLDMEMQDIESSLLPRGIK